LSIVEPGACEDVRLIARKPRPTVVIAGAGFGGLQAAKALSKLDVDVTIIDAHNHHCFQPLLYQVATAVVSPADIAWPIRGIFRRQANVAVVLARINGVRPAARLVETTAGSFHYDFLVLATGARHFYFGHEEWEQFAPGLKRIEDATRIRRRVLKAFEQAELSCDPAERRRLMTFVVVGGGPTGTEMAGAIAELARHTLRDEFRHIDPRKSRILLVEAGPRILPSFPENLARYAHKALERMGVEVRTGAKVTDCNDGVVALGDERIEAGTAIWAAGVIASPAADWLKADRDPAGRIKVKPNLSVPGHPQIFAIGDTASVLDQSGRPVPGIAPAAKQMGQYVAQVIRAAMKGQPMPGQFAYRHYGDFATIGRKAAIVHMGRFTSTGFFAWLLWSVAHIYFLIGLRNRIVVAFTWIWNYLTLQRGARLITET